MTAPDAGERGVVEEWRAVEGWPYEVSNRGNVRRSESGRGTVVGRQLRPPLNPCGYPVVSLTDGGRRRKLARVHLLVMAAFHPPKPEGFEANHIDGNKANNHTTNLEWVSRSENQLHAIRLGLKKVVYGERNGSAKLNPVAVTVLRFLRQRGFSALRLARAYRMSEISVDYASRGRTWKSVAYPPARIESRTVGPWQEWTPEGGKA